MPKGIFKRPADIGARISEGKSPGSVARKEKVRELYSQGLTPKEIEQKLGVPVSTVKTWIVGVRKHSTGFSRRRHGQAAGRVRRLTGREGEAIRQEMEAKESDACFFCGSDAYDKSGWFSPVFHHYDDGTVDRAHSACNAIRRHQAITRA
jgi:transposase